AGGSLCGLWEGNMKKLLITIAVLTTLVSPVRADGSKHLKASLAGSDLTFVWLSPRAAQEGNFLIDRYRTRVNEQLLAQLLSCMGKAGTEITITAPGRELSEVKLEDGCVGTVRSQDIAEGP